MYNTCDIIHIRRIFFKCKIFKKEMRYKMQKNQYELCCSGQNSHLLRGESVAWNGRETKATYPSLCFSCFQFGQVPGRQYSISALKQSHTTYAKWLRPRSRLQFTRVWDYVCIHKLVERPDQRWHKLTACLWIIYISNCRLDWFLNV